MVGGPEKRLEKTVLAPGSPHKRPDWPGWQAEPGWATVVVGLKIATWGEKIDFPESFQKCDFSPWERPQAPRLASAGRRSQAGRQW